MSVKTKYSLVMMSAFIFLSVHAQAQGAPDLPPAISFAGSYVDSAGIPVSGSKSVKFQILNPGQTCYLYEEVQTLVFDAEGNFATTVGSALGAGVRSVNDPGNKMSAVFKNSGTPAAKDINTNSVCGALGISTGSLRYLKVTVDGEAMTPNFAMSSVPSALVAETLSDGSNANSFVRLNTTAPAQVSQANLEAIFSTSKYPLLNSILGATPSNGQLLIGNGSDFTAATLTAGAGVTITNSAGAITIAASGGGSGTVTDVQSANSDIGVATGTSTPVLTLNSGTSANQIVKLNGSAQLPAVDGSLLSNVSVGVANVSGTLPVAKGGTGIGTAPGNAQILIGNGTSYGLSALTGDLSMTNAGVVTLGTMLGQALPAPGGMAAGEVLKFSGSGWVNFNLTNALANKIDAGSMPGSCGAGFTLHFASPSGSWVCDAIQITSAQIVDPTPAANYYVRPGGNDLNCNGITDADGASGACAFQTLQGALDRLPKDIKTSVTITMQTGMHTFANPVTIDKNIILPTGTLTITGTGVNIQDGGGGYSGPLFAIAAKGISQSGIGLTISNLTLQYNSGANVSGFDVTDGAVMLDAVTVTGMKSALHIRNGFAMLQGANTFSSSTTCPNLIYVENGNVEIAGGTTAVNMNSAGASGECRAVEVGHSGILRVQGTLNINLPATTAGARPLGLSIFGGSLELDGGSMTVDAASGPNNTGISQQGGRSYIGSGSSLTLSNINSTGLSLESGSELSHYGTSLSVNGGNAPNGPLIKVKDGSRFLASENISLLATTGTNPISLVSVSSGSIFRWEPYMSSKTMTMTGNTGSNRVGISGAMGALIDIGALSGLGTNPQITASQLDKFAMIEGGSTMTVKGNFYSTTISQPLMGDSSSSFTNMNSSVSFPMSFSVACSGAGLSAVSGTPLCYHSSTADKNFVSAVSDCALNQMLVCSSADIMKWAPLISPTGTIPASGYVWISDLNQASSGDALSMSVTSSGGIMSSFASASSTSNAAVYKAYYCCPMK